MRRKRRLAAWTGTLRELGAPVPCTLEKRLWKLGCTKQQVQHHLD